MAGTDARRRLILGDEAERRASKPEARTEPDLAIELARPQLRKRCSDQPSMADRNNKPTGVRTYCSGKRPRSSRPSRPQSFRTRARGCVRPAARQRPERSRIALCQIRIPRKAHLVEVGFGIDRLAKAAGDVLCGHYRTCAASGIHHNRPLRGLEARSKRFSLSVRGFDKHLLHPTFCVEHAFEGTVAQQQDRSFDG